MSDPLGSFNVESASNIIALYLITDKSVKDVGENLPYITTYIIKKLETIGQIYLDSVTMICAEADAPHYRVEGTDVILTTLQNTNLWI